MGNPARQLFSCCFLMVAAVLLYRIYLKRKTNCWSKNIRPASTGPTPVKLEIREQTFRDNIEELHDNIGGCSATVGLNLNTLRFPRGRTK